MKKATRFSIGALLFSIVLSGMAVAQSTYSGNGNTGFGDVIGGSTLAVSDDGTTLTFTLTKASSSLSDTFVMYIDSESGGITGTGSLTDTGDDLRRAISGFDGTNRSTITFANGFEPDHVIALNVDNIDFGGVWELVESGSHTFTASVDISATEPSDASVSFTVDFTELGITDSTFKFVATYLNETNAFRSDEAIGTSISGGNVGQNPVTFDGYETYQSSIEISGNEGWRLLSFPVEDPTVEDISDDTPVQGITGGDDASADANFYLNPASDGTSGNGYSEPTNVTTAIDEGLGYALYFYDNTTNGSSELPIKLDAEGSQPSNVTVTVSNTWTLVGNPYTLNLKLEDVLGNDSGAGLNDGLKGTARLYDDNTGNFVGVNLSTGILSPWQGFFLERNSSSTTSISIPDSGKTATDPTNTEFAKIVAPDFRQIDLTLDAPEGFGDTGTLYFHEKAGPEDDAYDATKLASLDGAPSFAFELAGKLVQQESRPFEIESEQIYFIDFADAGVSGEYTFSWSNFVNIPADWTITFTDFETGSVLNMQDEDSYTFSVLAQQKRVPKSVLSIPTVNAKTTTGNNRFGITLRPTSVSNELGETPLSFGLEQNYPNPFNPSTTISYTIENAGAVNISVYNLMGQKVATLVDESKAAGTYSVRWNASGAASGMYYYRLESAGLSITRKMTLIK